MYGYLVNGATVGDWKRAMEEEKERGMSRVKGESVCLDSEGAALLEDVDDLLGDGLTGGEGAEDGSKPVSGETERGHRAGGGGAWGQEIGRAHV